LAPQFGEAEDLQADGVTPWDARAQAAPKECGMVRATWNGAVLAESDSCQQVEGNYYFPPESIHSNYFKPSATRTNCPWKGEAHYYNIVVDGEVNIDGAWRYPSATTEAARRFEGYVAFWKGVEVEVRD